MKRRAAKVVVFLLLGAIVNVAVAWGCANWSVGADLYNIEWWGTSRLPANERHFIQRFQAMMPPEHDWTSNELVGVGFARREYFGLSEIYLNPDRGGGGSGGYPALVGVTRAGWPLHSLQCIDTHVDNIWSWDRDYQGAIVIQREVDFGGPVDLPRPLPLIPLWPGFAINTIFYAGVLWMMFAFPFVVRRRRRIKRGLCPACAYPVGTSPVCTECGGPIKRSAVRSQRI